MPLAGLIDQFDARAARCASLAELAGLLAEVLRELGFDYFALLHHASLRTQAGQGCEATAAQPGAGGAARGGTVRRRTGEAGAGRVEGGRSEGGDKGEKNGGETGKYETDKGRKGTGAAGTGRAGLIRIDNYPPEWAAELATETLAIEDPVHLASGRTNAGFAWDHLGGLIPLTARHREILARSRRHGLGPGFTVPANVPGEPQGSCSFAVRRGCALPARHLSGAELIGAHAFRAARRLHGFVVRASPPHLSRRELECLRLVAVGKSDWEIGRILGLAEETVRQYVKRARAAYDVTTRTQLVVHGLRDGWIGFGDAIPPDGGMG